MAFLLVNQTAVPSPSEMTVEIFDVSGGVERSAGGSALIDRVAVKRRLELTWAHLSGVELRGLLSAVGAAPFFEATYPDPQTGAARTMTCYAEERAAAVQRVTNGVPVWQGLKMRWIER